VHELREATEYFFDRVFVSKALDPNKPKDFLRILRDLGRATKGLAGAAEAEAMRAALRTLNVDWTAVTPQQRARIVDAARVVLTKPADIVIPKLEDTLIVAGKKIAGDTRKSAAKKFKLEIAVDLPAKDQKTIEQVAASQGNYVRDEYGRRAQGFSDTAKQIVAAGLEEGLGTKKISAKLKEKLEAAGRTESYWDLIASTFANRARVYSNLSSYSEAMIDWFRFDAVLDEATSDICRFMHGRRFQVTRALDRYSRAERVGPETAQPWLRQGENDDGDRMLYYEDARGNRRQVATIEESGVGSKDNTGSFGGALSDAALARAGITAPPLHGNCRSTIVPEM
jgi:SPP1 gp7 family putative phage head morphogenesis protein